MNLPRSEFHILLIEDSQPDAKIIERALREGGVFHRLTVIPDGKHALDYLYRLRDESPSADREPDLILLDLNLPGMDGCQVLTRIKSDPVLRMIPVVILTTSAAEEDVLRSYDLHANCYVTKPVDLEKFIVVVQSIDRFRLTIATLPSPR